MFQRLAVNTSAVAGQTDFSLSLCIVLLTCFYCFNHFSSLLVIIKTSQEIRNFSQCQYINHNFYLGCHGTSGAICDPPGPSFAVVQAAPTNLQQRFVRPVDLRLLGQSYRRAGQPTRRKTGGSPFDVDPNPDFAPHAKTVSTMSRPVGICLTSIWSKVSFVPEQFCCEMSIILESWLHRRYHHIYL